MKAITTLLFALSTLPLLAADEPPLDLNKIEAALKSAPNDPVLNYRKCQALFTSGKEQEAVDHAHITLEKFKAARNDLAWMKLGSLKAGKHRVDVHYNMGPSERAEKKDGIVRPYSFRVWTTDPEPKLVRVLDFELGYFDGKLLTAAIGESKGGRHANFGTVDPKSDFATVKKKVLEILAK
jgi:hypothetical protein